MSEPSILIVDKDYGFASDTKDFLVKNGFKVNLALSFQKGLELALKHIPVLIICELDLPERDGVEFCREIRSVGLMRQSYFMLLSSRNDNFVQILAYNSGADEFLTKPISERLLLSKIQAIFRRLESGSGQVNNELMGDHLRIDFERYLAIRGTREIELPKKEFQILTLLYKNPKRVFSREEIKNEIWEDSADVKSRTIDVHVKKLREKIGEGLIKTIKGVGYKFDQG